jgi:hypothetical protein
VEAVVHLAGTQQFSGAWRPLRCFCAGVQGVGPFYDYFSKKFIIFLFESWKPNEVPVDSVPLYKNVNE